jgi:hypothetical protein
VFVKAIKMTSFFIFSDQLSLKVLCQNNTGRVLQWVDKKFQKRTAQIKTIGFNQMGSGEK